MCLPGQHNGVCRWYHIYLLQGHFIYFLEGGYIKLSRVLFSQNFLFPLLSEYIHLYIKSGNLPNLTSLILISFYAYWQYMYMVLRVVFLNLFYSFVKIGRNTHLTPIFRDIVLTLLNNMIRNYNTYFSDSVPKSYPTGHNILHCSKQLKSVTGPTFLHCFNLLVCYTP